MSTAAVLPLSTAEVERVFSQVKLVKCDHINRMKKIGLNNFFYQNTRIVLEDRRTNEASLFLL
jgi:hypothetical protein